jgi:hypothetical protein
LALAHLNGRTKDAVKFFRLLGGKPVDAMLRPFDVTAAGLQQSLLPYLGPHADAIRRADAFAQNGFYDQAIAAYQAVLKEEKEPDMQGLLKARLGNLEMQADYDAGKTVSLMPKSGLIGWPYWPVRGR